VDLIQVGAYEAGSNPEVDEAISLRPAMETFLRQDMHIGELESDTRDQLRRLMQV
jgi:flagellum-specific ATP synthase